MISGAAFGHDIFVAQPEDVIKCLNCNKGKATKICMGCQEASYCDSCYTGFHSHGARRRHIYKRIVYGFYNFEEEIKKIDKEFKSPSPKKEASPLKKETLGRQKSVKFADADNLEEGPAKANESKPQKTSLKKNSKFTVLNDIKVSIECSDEEFMLKFNQALKNKSLLDLISRSVL